MISRDFNPTKSLQARPVEEARELREEARLLPFGPVRDAALKKARQRDAAAHVDYWLSSPFSLRKSTTFPAHSQTAPALKR